MAYGGAVFDVWGSRIAELEAAEVAEVDRCRVAHYSLPLELCEERFPDPAMHPALAVPGPGSRESG
ncbi:MAG: hypothetical protein HY908_22425 [Myxococcales bacterium]|nr:hypothetical protein [Myxococcales bacterium]